MGPVNRPLFDLPCMGYRRTCFAGLVTGAPGRAAMCSVSSGRAVLQNDHGNGGGMGGAFLMIFFCIPFTKEG
jgi:hypothetical protein